MIPTNDPNVVILSQDRDMFDIVPLGAFEFQEGFSLIGIKVLHKWYGKGETIALNERKDIITVQFDERIAKFAYPNAFALYLRFERPEYQRSVEKYLATLRRKTMSRQRKRSGLVYDEVEDTTEYIMVKEEVDRLVEEEIGSHRCLGYCFMYWSAKKRILKEKYGIDWKTPCELNPDVLFD